MADRQKSPFLGLSEHDISALSQHAVTRAYPKNTIIMNEGDLTDTLYIIVSGRVKVFLANEEGKEIVLDTQGPGEYFGEMVLDEGPRSASVMTLEPCRYLRLASPLRACSSFSLVSRTRVLMPCKSPNDSSG